MPSPFPGMDRWLEGELWMDVHHQLSTEIARQLSPKLLPKYFARAVRRNVIDDADEIQVTTRLVLPDISVTRSGAGGFSEGGRALAAPPHTIRMPHVTIEIRDAAERELVTAIEVLSPTNKRGTGYAEYLEKRGRVLNSTAHLVEIDLLRAGRRVPMRERLPDAPYFVFVSRALERPRTEIWPIRLDDLLPLVPIPLLAEDPDVGLDLQQAFTTIYDLLGYGSRSITVASRTFRWMTSRESGRMRGCGRPGCERDGQASSLAFGPAHCRSAVLGWFGITSRTPTTYFGEEFQPSGAILTVHLEGLESRVLASSRTT